jgi:hypothetical protein
MKYGSNLLIGNIFISPFGANWEKREAGNFPSFSGQKKNDNPIPDGVDITSFYPFIYAPCVSDIATLAYRAWRNSEIVVPANSVTAIFLTKANVYLSDIISKDPSEKGFNAAIIHQLDTVLLGENILLVNLEDAHFDLLAEMVVKFAFQNDAAAREEYRGDIRDLIEDYYTHYKIQEDSDTWLEKILRALAIVLKPLLEALRWFIHKLLSGPLALY